MKEIFDTEILSKSMWKTYDTMKNDNFKFQGYSTDDINMMINHILPYFEKIGEYEICVELKNIIEVEPKINEPLSN